MKVKMATLFLCLFALIPAFGQDKKPVKKITPKTTPKTSSITFKTSYKRGEVIRYKYSSLTTVLVSGKKIQPTKMEMIFCYRVLSAFGNKALVSFRIESYKDKRGKYTYPFRTSNPVLDFYLNGISKLRFLVAPGLQPKKIYGLENLAAPLLDKLPLKYSQKRIARNLLRMVMRPLGKFFAKANQKGLDRLFVGTKKVGDRMSNYNKIPGMMNIYSRHKIIAITTDKAGKKQAIIRMDGRIKWRGLLSLLGYRTTGMNGSIVVNERGVIQKLTTNTSQKINPFFFLSILKRRGGVRIPTAMTVKTRATMVLLADSVKKMKSKG